MELKHKLEQIFNNDYPGTDRFIADVIEPIFGNEIEYINDDLAEREVYAEKAKKAGIKHIKYIGDLTEKNYNADNIALLDVTLDDSKNIERSRVNIQQLIRSIMDYRQHLMIVFHYEDVKDKQWRFSYAYKGDSLKDSTSAKRYTYVFGKGYRGRTAAERFQTLADSTRNNEDFEKAFSVAALSDEFFDLYRAYYAVFVEYITGEKYTDEKKLNTIISRWNWLEKDESGQFTTTFDDNAKDVRDYIKKMFGRIVFLYFLQRKGWLYDADGNHDPRYMRHLFDGAGELKNTFLDDVLELLFFYVLNTKPEQRVLEASFANKDITILPGWEKIPFLNGGLFSQDEIDPKHCVFPAVYFDELFRFLDSYNFTIDENDQEDAEIGIDPEMLGRIFENLLEDNKDKGAFYTPKEIVDYMCRESIIAYLQNDKFSQKGNEFIRNFIETLNIDLLDTKQRDYIEHRLLKVKICDPAIGSGAFPMGLVNLLSKIFIVLRTYKTIDQAKMKRYIMQQSIYGVDIEKGAVDIARLRFWLAMIVEEKDPIPLPNLHFKIMQGNSLLESYNGINLTDLTKLSTELTYGESRGFWDTDDSERESLIISLKSYYKTSDHSERDRLFNNITNNVRRQLYDKDIILPTGIDPSANTDFFLWHTWFTDVFKNGGFDIVIGNPPFGAKLTSEEKSLYKNLYSDVHMRTPDTFCYFISQAIRLAKKNEAVVSFIVPNNMFFQNENEKTRILLTEKNRLLRAINLGDNTFENADVPTCIFICQTGKVKDYRIKYSDYRTYNVKNIPWEEKIDDLPVRLLATVPGHVLGMSEADINIINTIKSRGISIDNLAEEMACGISSGGDKIFRVDSSTISKYKLEKDLLHKVLSGSDISEYVINYSGDEIIYSTRESIIEYYPSTRDYLYLFYDKLSNRSETKKGILPWYSLNRNRYPMLFEEEKIIMRQTSDSIRCVYDDMGFYTLDSILIFKKNTTEYSYKYIASVLNSLLTDFLYKKLSQEEGRAFAQVKPANVRKLYIPKASGKEQKLLETLYDYQHYCYSHITEDNSMTELFVDLFNDIIDGCVYELFFREHMKEREIDIISYLYEVIKPIDGRDEYDTFNTIASVHSQIFTTNNPVRTRLKLFVSRSPEYLKPIIQH